MYGNRYLFLLNLIHNSILDNCTVKNVSSPSYKHYEIKPLGLKYNVYKYSAGFYSELYVDGRTNLSHCYRKGSIPIGYDSNWILTEIYVRAESDFKIVDTPNIFIKCMNKNIGMPLNFVDSRVFAYIPAGNKPVEDLYKWMPLLYKSDFISKQIAETLENILRYTRSTNESLPH